MLDLLCQCESEGWCQRHGTASEQHAAYDAARRKLGADVTHREVLRVAGLD